MRSSINHEVAEAWDKGDYGALNKMAETYANSRSTTLSGKWRLEIYANELSKQLQIQWPEQYNAKNANPDCDCGAPAPRFYSIADERWHTIDGKTQAWIAAYPKSPHAIVARAQYLMNRGWFYRGSDYAQNVPPEAWSKVEQYDKQAQSLLESTRPISSTDPIWFEIMFRLASDQGWSAESYDALIRDFKKQGHFYPGALTLVFYRMLPQWGGSPDEMEQFARGIAALTHADEGNARYARLYWNIAQEFPQELFTKTKANWPMMRSGFEDMIKQYPDPKNINALGYFACMANDFKTMNMALKRLGDNVTPEQWDKYMPYNVCLAHREQVTH